MKLIIKHDFNIFIAKMYVQTRNLITSLGTLYVNKRLVDSDGNPINHNKIQYPWKRINPMGIFIPKHVAYVPVNIYPEIENELGKRSENNENLENLEHLIKLIERYDSINHESEGGNVIFLTNGDQGRPGLFKSSSVIRIEKSLKEI